MIAFKFVSFENISTRSTSNLYFRVRFKTRARFRVRVAVRVGVEFRVRVRFLLLVEWRGRADIFPSTTQITIG